MALDDINGISKGKDIKKKEFRIEDYPQKEYSFINFKTESMTYNISKGMKNLLEELIQCDLDDYSKKFTGARTEYSVDLQYLELSKKEKKERLTKYKIKYSISYQGKKGFELIETTMGYTGFSEVDYYIGYKEDIKLLDEKFADIYIILDQYLAKAKKDFQEEDNNKK